MMTHAESSKVLLSGAQRAPSLIPTLESLIISRFPLESPALLLPKTGRLVWSPSDGKFGHAAFCTHHRPAPDDLCAATGAVWRGKSEGGEWSWMK